MLQNAFIAIAVFLAILIALTFGESLTQQAFAWLSHLTGLALDNMADIYHALAAYAGAHQGKILLALLLTVPICLWILRSNSQGQTAGRQGGRRRMAIVLALLLGWLGVHRFYLGQIGRGIVYLILCYVFTPLVVVLSLIDAIRFWFMDDEAFATPRQIQP